MCGTLVFGVLGDKIGRIKAVILANLCGFLGDFSTIFTSSLSAFSTARFVSGLAVDANTYLMYILGMQCCILAIVIGHKPTYHLQLSNIFLHLCEILV